MARKLKEFYDKFAGDPYGELSRDELLSRIVAILKSRPQFEGNRPLGSRLGVWLDSLEKQVKREHQQKIEMEPRLI